MEKTTVILLMFFFVSMIAFHSNMRLLTGTKSNLVFTTSIFANAHDGYSMLKNPLLNKGMSFTEKERVDYNLKGLLPAGPMIPLNLRVENAMNQFNKKPSAIEKYIFLHTIQDSDETLFYAILIKHTKQTMPYVYTPTVGQACQEWSNIYRHTPRGLYISINDKGKIRSLLDNYQNQNIKVIVFTDGERILGLGKI